MISHILFSSFGACSKGLQQIIITLVETGIRSRKEAAY